jgi:hypothetical protein
MIDVVGTAIRWELREEWSSELENKKPDSDESGLAVEISGVFQPWRIMSAQIPRRQADPCQRARLTVVTLTRTAAAQFWTEHIIAAMTWRSAQSGASGFFRRDRPLDHFTNEDQGFRGNRL